LLLSSFVTAFLFVSFDKHSSAVLHLVGMLISFSGRSPTLAVSLHLLRVLLWSLPLLAYIAAWLMVLASI
jgi:hypothetical protein